MLQNLFNNLMFRKRNRMIDKLKNLDSHDREMMLSLYLEGMTDLSREALTLGPSLVGSDYKAVPKDSLLLLNLAFANNTIKDYKEEIVRLKQQLHDALLSVQQTEEWFKKTCSKDVYFLGPLVDEKNAKTILSKMSKLEKKCQDIIDQE